MQPTPQLLSFNRTCLTLHLSDISWWWAGGCAFSATMLHRWRSFLSAPVSRMSARCSSVPHGQSFWSPSQGGAWFLHFIMMALHEKFPTGFSINCCSGLMQSFLSSVQSGGILTPRLPAHVCQSLAFYCKQKKLPALPFA